VIDRATPVLIGTGQAQQRLDDLDQALEPVDLLADAARTAVADAGSAVLGLVDTIAVASIVSWPYPDAGAALGRRLGIEPRWTIASTVGGNSPQLLLNKLASDIAEGRRQVALLGGAECVYSRWRARREPKVWLEWSNEADPVCGSVIGDPRPGSSDYEMAHSAVAPTQIYPLFETALRARAGRAVHEHQRHVAELWSRFAVVAASNPNAWSRQAYSADEIRTVSPENRVVAFPYTKRMCANIDVDQAAAVVLCSFEVARAIGVPDDQMVFPLAGADAHDHYFFSERWSLAESPGIRETVGAALTAAGAGVDDVARFDLYSCFPAAVEIAMDALGLEGAGGGDDRPLTVTGGLAFAGGPANNYATHAIAAMVEACRRDPGSIGLVTALGWYVTKHSAGLYSTNPPRGGFRRVPRAEPQARIDAAPRRKTASAYSGPAEMEATSVVFERDGTPSLAIVTALTPEGHRALANTRDVDVCLSLTREPWEGRTAKLRSDGVTNLLDG
jgi:acetyl-CoA C-acetyltransferase